MTNEEAKLLAEALLALDRGKPLTREQMRAWLDRPIEVKEPEERPSRVDGFLS